MLRSAKISVGILFVLGGLIMLTPIVFSQYTFITDPNTGLKLGVEVDGIFSNILPVMSSLYHR